MGVCFEEQNIDTSKMSGELLTAVFAGIAQKESESISGNMRWSYKRRMENGTYVPSVLPYGYIRIDGKIEIDEKRANVIRQIFSWYLSGHSADMIADMLNTKQIPSRYGGVRWSQTAVRYILTNEKYAGNSLWQKYYICRSPMAEFIMKDLVKKAGLDQSIQIESAATSTEEIGNPVYPPARRKLSEHGIDCSGKRARQLLNSDYEKYDLLIGMDRANLRSMYRICGGDFADKMHLLMDFTNRPGEVADPWYTDDFDTTWRDVEEGCRGVLHHIQLQSAIHGGDS